MAQQNKKVGGLTMLQGMVLDYTAEGKSPRQIAEILGISVTDAAKMAYDLLDREIVTDTEQRRKLQVYRLEKIVEALWQRVMQNAEKDDVRNLIEVLDKLSILLALNKERDEELYTRMHQHQLGVYLQAINGLIMAFKALTDENRPKTDEEWTQFAADQLEEASALMMIEGQDYETS